MNDLPVTELIVHRCGVGEFIHEGVVTGDHDMILDVAEDDLDDLLQSLTVSDPGGRSPAVRYPAADPLERVLRSYALDLSAGTDLISLLRQATGEHVTIDVDQQVSGLLLGLDVTPNPRGPETTHLTLSTENGLRRIDLARVAGIRFNDAAVQRDLDEALAACATHRGRENREVRIALRGDGERTVRVSYLRPVPVWKTSYRLQLQADGSGLLQGWAIIDNPTSTDLEDIRLTVVAGSANSFVMRLAEPHHAERPRLDPPLPENEGPMTHQMGVMADAAAPAGAPPMAAATSAGPRVLRRSIATEVEVEAAQTGVTGLNASYRMAEPVTIPRHSSAMIPFVQASVPASGISVWDATDDSPHPRRAIRLQNTTGLQLAAGPLTIDDGGFAGAARLDDLMDGQTLVATHARDLAVRVEYTTGPGRYTHRSAVVDGRIRITATEETEHLWAITSDAERDRVVMIDTAGLGPDIRHQGPAPASTDGEYRFGVRITGAGPGDEAGDLPIQVTSDSPATLTVTEVQHRERHLSASDASIAELDLCLDGEPSPSDRAILHQLQELAAERTVIEAEREATANSRQEILDDQERIRANLADLAHDSDLYRRHIRDLTSQEDDLAALTEHDHELLARLAEVTERRRAVIREANRSDESAAADE